MTPPTMNDVLARLEAVERQNRRMKRWGAGCLLLAIAMTGMAMAQEESVPEVVRARRFEVLDGKGGVRVAIGHEEETAFLSLLGAGTEPHLGLFVTEAGQAAVLLHDERGTVRSTLSASAESSGLFVFDGKGRPVIHMVSKEDGSAILDFTDGRSARRLSQGIKADGALGQWLMDEKGQPRVFLTQDGKGGGLYLHEGTGRRRAVLSVGADGTTSLDLSDKNEATRILLGVIQEVPLLSIQNTDRKPGVMLGLESGTDPSLRLTGRDGKTIFKVPE